MKKLITICLLIATVFPVKAQDAKPTKEQTIEFIKAYFTDLKIDGWHNGEYNKWDDNYKVKIIGTNVTVEWDHYNWTGKLDSHQLYELDVKDISALGISVDEGNGYCQNGITFYTVNKKASIKYIEGLKQSFVNHFDISIYRGKNCIEDVSQTQIYKAFNHLRKLCGAPEPIKF